MEATEEFHRWLAALALARDAPSACLRAGEIEDPWSRLRALTGIVESLVGAGLGDRARFAAARLEEAARQVPPPGLDSKAIGRIAATLAAAGLTEPAAEMAREARDTALKIEPRQLASQALASIAAALAHAGLPDEARDAVAKARDAIFEIKPTEARTKAMDALVKTLIDDGFLDEALSTALRLEDQRLRLEALCDLAPKLVNAGLVEQGNEARRQAAITVHSMWEHPERYAESARSTIATLARGGLPDEAAPTAAQCKASLLQLKDPEKRTEELCWLTVTLAESGLVRQAEEITPLIQGGLAIKDAGRRARALEIVASSFFQAGLTEGARELAIRSEAAAREIWDRDQRSNALKSVAVTLGQAGFLEEALGVASVVPEPRRRIDALCSVAAAMARKGASRASQATVRRAESEASRIESPSDRSVALASVVEALIGLGSLDAAAAAARQITDAPRRSRALASVANGFAAAGRFRDARLAAEACDLSRDRLAVFTSILCEFTNRSRPQLARVLRELQSDDPAPHLGR
jgi:hypothetical protein